MIGCGELRNFLSCVLVFKSPTAQAEVTVYDGRGWLSYVSAEAEEIWASLFEIWILT